MTLFKYTKIQSVKIPLKHLHFKYSENNVYENMSFKKNSYYIMQNSNSSKKNQVPATPKPIWQNEKM